jgi:hypothetical protein
MSAPRFSILIPTRDRPVTFRHTLATALSQTGDDFEIVVADNCSSPAVAAIVDEAGSSKIRYIRSTEILPMTKNWELGLAQCRGEYVTVLGDDDGLLPSTLHCARLLLNASQAKILNWAPHTYWWPDTIVYWNSNRLIVNFGEGAIWYTSRSMLKSFYEDAQGYDKLPMIYTSFVHRDCIDAVVSKYGSYFNIPQVPDVVSGIVNLLNTDRILLSHRPLSIRGNSGKSNGTAQWARSLGGKQRETFFQEENARLQEIIHPSLVPSPNLAILIASVKLQCKDMFFPNDAELKVNIGNVVRQMIAGLNSDPDAYDINLSEVLALATKHAIVVNPVDIPVKTATEHRKYSGPIYGAEHKISTLVIDCDQAGVQDVAAAARLADALMPRYTDSYVGIA